jgi:hypothetical protein
MIKREDIDEKLANLKISDHHEGELGEALVERFYFNKGL